MSEMALAKNACLISVVPFKFALSVCIVLFPPKSDFFNS